MTTTDQKVVAWHVEVDSMTCIVFAVSLAKAKWVAVNGYRNAGYGRKGEWPPISAGRAERFDRSPLRNQPPRPWTEDYVLDMGLE